jgi:truncated hemoglobin YjbI
MTTLLCSAALLAGLACETDPNAIEDEGYYRADSLYARIGGERVLRRLVDYYFENALADPQMNFTRHNTPHEWEPNPGNTARLKEKYYTFISSATGGPARYQGEAISTAHGKLEVTPEQFARSVELWKQAAERSGVEAKEQEEFLLLITRERPAVLGKNAVPATQPARSRVAGQ